MEVRIPDIGDFAEVEVIEVLVKVGDEVAAEAPLLVLESDKATLDVPSPAAGTVAAVHAKVGDKVGEGTLIVELAVAGDGGGGETAPDSDSAAGSGGDNVAAAESVATEVAGETSDTETVAETASGGEEDLLVPDIGDFKDVPVIEVLVGAGDAVAKEQSLIILESDKATLEVPAAKGGVVAEVFVKAGDKVNVGDRICRIAVSESSAAASATTATTQQQQPPTKTPQLAPQPQQQQKPAAHQPPPTTPVKESKSAFGKVHAGPAVRRFARELGVDLTQVKGSARLGRVVKNDVRAFVKAQMSAKQSGGAGLPEMPEIDFGKFGETEIHPLARVRKLSAVNLRRNWLVAPHVTQFADADITDMEKFRKSLAEDAKKNGYKMTPLAFLLKAAAAALKEYPRFNSSLATDGENLVMKKYFHIGVAVDTPDGLVVPVLRDVDRKGLADIARELAEVSKRAREGKLKSEEMRGGCFTISSLGGIGGAHFTPIINLPEAAILGVGRSQTTPQWDGESFQPRLMLPLALSYDHRIIDGADGARFITHYAELLTDTRRLAL